MRDADTERTDVEREAPRQSLGDMLRGARAAQELSLEEVAAELRMEEGMLRALEEHRFEALGAPVFAKGYLKQYAQRLGLSTDDVLAEYYRIAEPRDVRIEPSRVIKLRDERQITIWIVAVLLLAVLSGLLYLWWAGQPVVTTSVDLRGTAGEVGSRPQSSARDADGASAPAGATVRSGGARNASTEPPVPDVRSGEPAAQAVGRRESAAAPGDEPASAVPLSAARDQAAPRDQAAVPSREPSAVPRMAGSSAAQTLQPERPAVTQTRTAAPGSPEAETSSAERTGAAASAATDGPTLRVVLEFREDSWVEATDAEGRRLFYGLGRAGGRANVIGVPPIDVLLGNADGVELEVGGEPYAVPRTGRQGNVARFTLSSD